MNAATMQTHYRLLIAAGALIGMVTFVSPVEAQESDTKTLHEYVGTYDYASSIDQGRALVKAAFEKAIEQLNPILRPMARRKLQSSDPLVRRITIDLPSGDISVRFFGEKTVSLVTPPGQARSITMPNGKEVRVTQRFASQRIEQVFVGERGKTRNTLTLLPDGKSLSYRSVISSSLLETPVTVTLLYRRVGE